MSPIILYELQKYTLTELQSLFLGDEAGCSRFIRLCEERRILDKRKAIYAFRYVGILVSDSRLVLFMPKYVANNRSQVELFRIMRQLVQVLKISSLDSVETDELDIDGDISYEEPFGLLSVIDFLMQDYMEYGLFRKEKREYVLSGPGEIDWQRTIDSQQAYLLSPYTPVYLDVITEETSNDREHIVRSLHKKVLHVCSKLLQGTGLHEFFPYPQIEFPDTGYVPDEEEVQLSLIQSAMNEEFSDHKIRLLRALYAFISKKAFDSSDNSLLFYGTRSFHIVWEKCCAYVMEHRSSIVDRISRPVWASGSIQDKNKDTLIPDIVRILVQGQEKTLLIADAKYYSIAFREGRVYGQPGIEDIVKQQIYEKALHPFMLEQDCGQVRNVFLFPSCNSEARRFGQVSLDFLPELEPIQLFYLPAEKLYELVIRQKRWTSTDWQVFIEELRNP